MLAKLISLLLHAKAGAISGVFLLGATGALVSVSAANGVTTITVTQASPSASANTGVNHSESASPKASKSPKPSSSPDPLSPAKPADACADQAKANAFQVQRVDSAFQGFHTDLMKLRGQRAVVTIEKADVLLKQIRQAAVKAIHATMTCKTADDDEDKTETETDSHDAATSTTSLNTDRENDETNDEQGNDKQGKAKKATTTPITFSGTDPTAIADQAVAAMQVAFDTAKSAAASTPKPSKSPESHSPKVPQNSHKPEDKGKGNDNGHHD